MRKTVAPMPKAWWRFFVILGTPVLLFLAIGALFGIG